ncbi:hypothetical protein J1N35_018991 [Gossypium stocksii]|uniref:Aminotransferase-like plant mobile domain-containing protein n=1 Tax=Gossypium stocksii TaxID=47602 RepID=A0A9D4A6P3_9ROSI|nr:hypothetical protein J1N35_018991 [Gossypium stocksii]
MLKSRGHGLSYRLDVRIMPYLDAARFGLAALIRVFELRGNLISTPVERRRPEMHTFDLPCEECTITLKNVAMQLELLVDGDAVIGLSGIADPADLCYSLLGCSPGDGLKNLHV